MAPTAVSKPDPQVHSGCRVAAQSQARVYLLSIYSHDSIDAYPMMGAILPVHYQGLYIGDAVDQTQYTICFQSFEGATGVLQPH